MASDFRSYLLHVTYFVSAACLWVLIRFVGLSSVPAFATFDYDSLDHAAFFRRAIFLGCVIGTVVFFVSRWLDSPVIRRRPYGVLILLHAFVGIICVSFVLFGLTVFNRFEKQDALMMDALKTRMLSTNYIVMLTYYSIVSFALVIIREINKKFGPGNLRKLVLGAFYHPREIETIVMFLDLKNSTTYAERLGHLEFGRLIQDCFIDMSVVADHKAQFYQYVGDESILLWDVADGVENANCLRAYFAFNRQLEARRDYYQSRYELMPVFKAGVNCGLATVIEVGDIKREISYLGDVLNTAARIQGLCNQHGEHLLISESVYERLASVPVGMEIDTIGNSELRGREKAVRIYRVKQRSSAGTSS